jgi:hypothetical protein
MMPRRLFISLTQLLGAPLLIVLAACQGPRETSNLSLTTSRPINLLHRGDPNLAGVIIYKDDPVNMAGDPQRGPHDHPIGVVYYFWDDAQVHDVAYDKRGGIVRDSWFKRFTPTSKTDWVRVDFSYGSDPKFVRHADPRKAR